MAIVVEIKIENGKVLISVGGCGKTKSGGAGGIVTEKNLSASATTGTQGGAPPANSSVEPGGGGIGGGVIGDRPDCNLLSRILGWRRRCR